MYLNTLQIVFWITYGMNVILDISGPKVSLHNNLEDMVHNLVHIGYYLAQYQIPIEYIKIHLKEYMLKFLPKSLPISKWTVSSCWHNNGRCFYYNQFQMFDHNKTKTVPSIKHENHQNYTPFLLLFNVTSGGRESTKWVKPWKLKLFSSVDKASKLLDTVFENY